MSGGFQSQVNVQPAPGVVGDFCDANPRYSVDAGPGGLVAGLNGVVIGRFAWATYAAVDDDGAPAIVDNTGSGPVTGFVHREQQGLIVDYLAPAGMKTQRGFGVTLYSGGGFWAKNEGSDQALSGMKAYARYADGSIFFGAPNAPSTAVVTGAVAASTASVTGSIADNILTVTAVGSGVLVPGGTLSGTGVASGTKIVTQLSGTPGGVGEYAVNIPEQDVDSTTISETYGTLTVSGVSSGVLGVGDTLSGADVVAGTSITALLTGVGGTGTYVVDNNTVVGSTTITAGTAVETKWFARSSGLPGEIVKISDKPLG